jgi:hypothetical protein
MRPLVFLALSTSVAACSSTSSAPDQRADPAAAEVALEGAAHEWSARLVLDNGTTGIWTVEPQPIFPQYAAHQLVGLDDDGRCHVMISYSGKWTHRVCGDDVQWLGAICHGEIDPRDERAELYVAGARGNVYQVRSYDSGDLDCRLIAQLPGLEVHTLICGDLDPRSPGAEVLAFTSPGHVYRLSPTGPHGTFVTEHLEALPGRVRDALLLPGANGDLARIAAANRAGMLQVLEIDAQGLHWNTIHSEPMGFGRVELRKSEAGPTVLYSTLDDGRVLRHEELAGGEWATVTIYAGPQGPRGVASGSFDADPTLETVAVFGYSSDVQLLTRRGDAWSVETIFTDRDRGHWLAAGEFDGRNGTDELVGSGYGGRIFMLAREPGYGRARWLTENDASSR